VTDSRPGASEHSDERPLVSAVIPTHGRPQQVKNAVDSVLAQDYPGPIECIVLHDNEEPNPALASSDPHRRVRVLTNQTRSHSRPGGRNAGIEAASGELIGTLDDDDTWLPSKVKEQVDLLTSHPEALVVASGMLLHTAGGERAREAPRAVDYEQLLRGRVPELHSSNLMARRRVFDLVGLYDEDVPLPEDWDWLLKVARHGPILSVPAPLIWVDRSRPLGSGDRWRYRAVGLEKLLVKHPDLTSDPKAAAGYHGKIAFSYAAGGDRRAAIRWMREAARTRRISRWTPTTGLLMLGVPVRWVEVASGWAGKSV
jgi:glycosyltransferase involved in cell wall biosynthesis